MSPYLKPVILSLGLVAGVAFSAHAQTASSTTVPGTSIANLPVEGPRASSHETVVGSEHMPVTASGNYPGPAPGASTGQVPPRFQKPADWDQNAALHPYTSGMGPKPN